ncbi:Rv3235 family protein [Rhodococcoides yunnanense]|uniref:Rv3235 family protein n=1 Tax=Rhodococcoides yunnanense TaxID=278209 RepID=A0ABU4BAB4_9NOCA|nr:Rv3235 family protein [Rhodococcus yunnanensis]MDV6261138.1 Rv3235 family protein [Rhodococcus yunnanensis]
MESNEPPDTPGITGPSPRLPAEQHCFLSRAAPFEPPLSSTTVHTWDPAAAAEPRPVVHRTSVRSNRSRRRAEPAGRPVVPADARSSADRAMRMLIEVIDRRRSADQLSVLFTTPMIDLVRTIVRNPPPGRRLGFAAVHRVHVVYQSDVSAEIFGSYTRGPRMFAFAGRIELAVDPRRPGWTVTSLRVG